MESGSLSWENLDTYLNDHLAGSVGALELVEHLTKNHAGSPLEKFFADLYVEITADQNVLRDLIRTFELGESPVRKAGAWIAEKLSRVKLGAKGGEESGIGFVQALEGLELGITGKQLLWRSLAAASESFPQLKGIDYAKLERRAVEQRDLVEEKRVAATLEALRQPNE